MSDCYTPQLGVDEVNGSKWTLSPNPATYQFTVTGAPDDLKIAIYDVAGKKVASGTDVSRLAPGLYLVVLRSAAGSEVVKLVKQ
ncbi:T9SS type A sorting domain-containing protein [Flavobacterium sp. N1718]|nr:T9SS type A sorting domain-containing protein [Flavobacterium sp. N1718]